MDEEPDNRFDALIVGAGFAGLYMLHQLRGLGLTARVLEQGADVGGTWYWNRYPGARCDIESLDYSYSFSEELQQEWCWSERYAGQAEILRYAKHVAERFELRRDIQFNTRVTSAVYDEAEARWTLTTAAEERFTAHFCIMATGCLSVPQEPPFPGLDRYQGRWYQTGRWPHEPVDFTGQHVGVIGTGSSAIQSIPRIAAQARHLYVFQRTPNFSVPAWNRPLDPEREREVKAEYPEFRRMARESRGGFLVAPHPNMERSALEVTAEERQTEYERRWAAGGFGMRAAFVDLLRDKAANDTVTAFVHAKIRELVHDPAVAELLLPHDHPMGTKRLCVDTGYYATYNQDNVTLVDIRATPIQELTPGGLRTTECEYELDSIVFAIGFDAMTGALLSIDIRGRDGVRLREQWAAGPRSYLGLAVAGFPNLFTITGPGSPSVLSNMLVSIEQHVEWVTDCIAYLHERSIRTIEATVEAEDAWVAHSNDVAETTLYPLANSWYMGANIAGKPFGFMPYVGGVGAYRQTCADIAEQGYTGFALTGHPEDEAAPHPYKTRAPP